MVEVRKNMSTSKRSKSGNSGNGQCFWCKEYGHIQQNYPTKLDEGNEIKCVYAFVADDDNYHDIVLMIFECIECKF